MFKRVFLSALVAGGAILPMVAGAEPAVTVDVSAATDALDAVKVAVVAIGTLMVAAAAAGIAYRWVTAFLVK